MIVLRLTYAFLKTTQFYLSLCPPQSISANAFSEAVKNSRRPFLISALTDGDSDDRCLCSQNWMFLFKLDMIIVSRIQDFI